MIETPAGISVGQHLRLGMNDVSAYDENATMPVEDHVHQLIEFIHTWDREHPILIHCLAGISRSSASALIAQCIKTGPGKEHEMAQNLRRTSQSAHPNRLLIELADEILGLEGRLINAVEDMPRGESGWSWENEPFSIPAVWEASP